MTPIQDPESSPRFLRDFGARHGIEGREEVSKIFGKAAERIDWLEKYVIELQGHLIERNSELALAMECGHKAALAKRVPTPEYVGPVWISADERVPESDGWVEVLVCREGGFVCASDYWSEDRKFWPANGNGEHWAEPFYDVKLWAEMPAGPPSTYAAPQVSASESTTADMEPAEAACVTVPKQPTEDMVASGVHAILRIEGEQAPNRVRVVYRAMLNARPISGQSK